MNKFNLDMDGVVADWVTNAAAVIGYRLADPTSLYSDEEWNILRSDQHLFRDLPLMLRCEELVSLARQYRDILGWELTFLTAIPHNNDVPWAFHDKMMWAQEHFPDIPVHFGPHSYDKQHHCKSSGDILVDDRVDNCEQWVAAGGIAFKVDLTLDSAIAELAADLNRRLSEKALAEAAELVLHTL
jgi:5'(3')-deoxyribonucleotidase